MAAEIVELIVELKDLFSQGYEKLSAMMETLPQKEQAVNTKLNQVRSQANDFYAKLTNDRVMMAEVEKEKNLRTLYGYYKQGLLTAEQYSAGVKTVNAQALAAAAEPTAFEKIKSNWKEVAVTVVAVWVAISKAVDYAKLGAAALQAEESFASVTASYGVNGDKLLAKMTEVSDGIIDQSDLMQRAVKALQQGLSAEQIVELLEVARSAARTAGTDIVQAFDGITNAVANQTTRALKLYGIVIDQNKAMEEYARTLGVSKDALNEQQQSQALANAAIAEGRRQMQAMGDITLNASERIQKAGAQLHELKETIGKGVLAAAQGLGGILYWLAAGAMTAAAGLMKVGAGLLYVAGRFDAAKKLSEDANIMFDAAGEVAGKAMDLWKGISLATAEAAAATKGVARAQQDAANEAAISAAKQKEAAELVVSAKKAELASFEAAMNYEMALEKQRYSQGKITLQEYLSFVKQKQEEHVEKMIELKKKELEALAAMDLTASERIKKETEINEAIKQIRIKAATDQLKVEQELTADLKKEHDKSFESWKSLQELKLNTLKSSLDLQNNIEETMVKQGLMRQSELLDNQLSRIREFYDARIRKADETMQEIAELESQDLGREERERLRKEWEAAYNERKNLQMELEGAIKKSEFEIGEARKQEELEAAKFIAEITKDRAELTVIENEQKLDQLKKFYRLGLVSAEQYYDALSELEETLTSKFKEELKERTEQLNLAIQIVTDRRRRLEETLQGMITNSFDDVKKYFGDWKKALSTDIDDMQQEIDQFMRHTTFVGYETFWNATLYGRKLIEMTGTTIYEWAARVGEYINYIKAKVAELDDTINGLRMQLAQLRGDRLAEIEMWYAIEKQKLEERFGDLDKTAEYYEALALIEEIYKEKRKKILEEMAADQDDYDSKTGKGSASAGGAGGLAGGFSGSTFAPPDMDALREKLTAGIEAGMTGLAQEFSAIIGEEIEGLIPREMSVKKEVQVTASLAIENNDHDYFRRLFKDILWPMFEEQFRLMGVEL